MLAFPSLRLTLKNNGIAVGTFCELPCAESVEITALAGWDFVVVDCEHAPITAAALPGLVRAAAAAGVPAIVRVASNDAAAIQHALDCGAAGVQVPQIASVDAARRAIAAARFHPTGERGFNPFVRAASYSVVPVADFMTRAADNVLLALQVESAAGVESLPGILELDGIDVIFIGPYDLSQSLGIPGDVSHPDVLATAGRIAEAVNRRGMTCGVFTGSERDTPAWLGRGIRYLCCGVDTVALLEASRQKLLNIRAYCDNLSHS
ncbi:MAG: aldolase/citrate lyase family protein [Acidobacteriota bacterium]|nr:aldolase/citrate lyase family protein [Acidobacteriota bacterium]